MAWYLLLVFFTFHVMQYQLNASNLGEQTKKSFSIGQARTCSLTKMYFHKGQLTDRLICYFDQEPLCMYHPAQSGKNNIHSIELFLPMSFIKTKEVRAVVEQINKENNNPEYNIAINEVKLPLSGIKITIQYDSHTTVCEYSPSRDAITGHKGLVVSMHHKKILETLAIKSDKVLHKASLDAIKPKIMLDFGHGGMDEGKVTGNIKEKDINLQVGTKVAQLLRSKGYQVQLTRSHDLFVPLDVRTLLANKQTAHIFVSIHANAAPSSDVAGIETYWSARSFYPTTFIPGSAQQVIKNVMSQLDESSKLLAQKIHSNVITVVKNRHAVTDRRTKQSLAQVLIGTDMPSALIEIGFLSNPHEFKKLQDPHYQLLIAQGISTGIEDYCAMMFA